MMIRESMIQQGGCNDEDDGVNGKEKRIMMGTGKEEGAGEKVRMMDDDEEDEEDDDVTLRRVVGWR